MKSVTVVADDRVGLLADISYILGKAGINIEGLYADVVGGKAVISMEVRDVNKASDILAKSGFKLARPDSIVVKVKGDVERVAAMLESEKVALKEAEVLAEEGEERIVAVCVDKPRKAVKVLNDVLFENLSLA